MIDLQTIGSRELWYLIGLVATDGCLSKDGRHVEITAKERSFLIALKRRMKISNQISEKRNGRGMIHHHIQIGGRAFYDFLLAIGLHPRKSHTLGELRVDEKYFVDFLRGVIDGDGCIRSWRHPRNGVLQWSLRIYSASFNFVSWIMREVDARFQARGALHQDRGRLFVLKFGKMAAQEILSGCYYKGGFALARKKELASLCASAGSGWSRCKTIGQVAERYTRRTQNGSPQRQLWGNKSLKFGER